MRSSREGSRGPRSITLVSQNRRAIAIFVTLITIVALMVGQAGLANAGDSNEIGADSSGNATVNSGGGNNNSGGGGSGATGDQTGSSDTTTVVRPSGDTQTAAEKAQVRRDTRQERRADRRDKRVQQRTSPDSHKVTICHRTDSYANPYVVNTPDISSSGHLDGGHDTEHLGPLFYPEIPQGTEWGDIIPPYTYKEVDPWFVYPGLNWTAEGQAIWENGCNIPKVYHPAIDVSKTCPASARIGDEITYSITVTNTGDEDLVNVVVNDPLLGGNLGAFPTTLAPGDSVTKTFTHTVAANDPDPLTNSVTANAKGKVSDDSVSDSDSCDTDITHVPGIDVSKSCPASAKVGEEITYSITVTNTGDEPLNDVKVDDTILGDLSASFPDTLAVGGSVTKTFKHTVTGSDDPVHNEVTATATGADSNGEVSDTDSCDTDVQHEPGIDVTKSCVATASIGDEISYTVTVTNTGNEPLNDVTVVDTILGDVSGDFPDSLAVGDSATRTLKHTVTASDPDPLVNKVTASGKGADSEQTVSAQDECRTDIVHNPGIDVTKSCTAAAAIGDEVTYTITVENTGDEPLNDVTVNDSLLGDLSGSYPDSLAVGESVTKTFKHTVTASDPDPLPNEVTASGVGADSDKEVSDKDSCETDITHEPGIDVSKSCPATVPLGGTITYSITVKNTGDEPLKDVVVNDPLLGGDLGAFPGTLAVGQSVTETFNYTPTANDPDPLPNEVSASGTGVDSGKDVSDKDSCETDITHEPGIDVSKSCPQAAKPGEEIIYSITVTNTGNEALDNLSVKDTLLGNLSGSFPDSLAVGESVTKTFPYTVLDDVDPVHNEVTAEATGVDSNGDVSDTASCDTDVQHTPGIDVTKSCPATGLEGDTITYNITVKNTGDEPLNDVVVNDPLLGGDLAGFPTSLTVGQSVTKSFEYTIPAGTASPLTNEVSASGVGADSGQEVADTDSCGTAVHHPAIQLDKTVDKAFGSPGDKVTYSYLVENTGDVTLFDIVVTDDILGKIGTIPSLAPGATFTLYKDYVLPETREPIVNVAIAAGCDEDNHCVQDDGTAVVAVVLGERERNPHPKGKVERGGVLPFTGSDVGMFILFAGALALAGVAFNLVSRRRRDEA